MNIYIYKAEISIFVKKWKSTFLAEEYYARVCSKKKYSYELDVPLKKPTSVPAKYTSAKIRKVNIYL